MIYRFDASEGLIVVKARATGPKGKAVLRLALDTGATNTLVNAGMLEAIGCDPGVSTERVEITTGSGIEFAPRVSVKNLFALGRGRKRFKILAHTLPPSAGVDGLLGLDFLRGGKLTIDFGKGQIAIR